MAPQSKAMARAGYRHFRPPGHGGGVLAGGRGHFAGHDLAIVFIWRYLQVFMGGMVLRPFRVFELRHF
jgi:hypothetical protein